MTIYNAYTFNTDQDVGTNVKKLMGDKWVRARPMYWRPIPQLFKELWLVLRGRADLIVHPGQEEPDRGG